MMIPCEMKHVGMFVKSI